MRNSTRLWLSLIVIITLSNFVTAQTSLGSSKTFMRNLKKQLENTEKTVLLQVENSKTFKAKINYRESNHSTEFLIGEIKNVPDASFYIKVKDKSLEGHIIFKKTKKAYKYYSDAQGNAYVSKVDINKLICTNYKKAPQNVDKVASKTVAQISPALLNLQSLPGAAGCILLDFDGYYMPPGNFWNNGNSILAAPSGMSDADVLEFWELVSEDYRPFNLNITTSEAVFDSYPKNRRMRTVVTPTDTAAPGSGGASYIGSFNWDNDAPNWVFELSGKWGGDAASHEIGHTFDLGDDGFSDQNLYYGIPGTSWAPIMGMGGYRTVVQWSKGEYNNANNKEDDVAIIASSKFGIGYRADDYGDNPATAGHLEYDANGTIIKKDGIITTADDRDMFTFTTGGGDVSINVNTIPRNGDIHLLIVLYDDITGTSISAGINPDPFVLNTSINLNVPAGKYLLRVSGVGAGNPADGGYSSYGSIGSYSITGTIPPLIIPPTTDVVTVYEDCAYTGFSGGLTIGDYNLARLNSLGVLNDDISSISVAEGFQAILYEDDNFTGASIVVNSDNSCLDTTWNDNVTSVRVIAHGATNLGNKTYFLQNRNSELYMNVQDASTADGANINQRTSNLIANQRYTFTHLGDGLYTIIANHSGKSLTVKDSGKFNGTNVEQQTYDGTANQQFILVATNQFFKIIARHSGKLVDVEGASTADGANVQQWENNNQSWGQWLLIPTTVEQTSTLIQAENYSAMHGILTEATTDSDGGLNVGHADRGDWMRYNNINFPTSGSYVIEYRVASAVNGARISSDLNTGTTQLGRVKIPNTGGWQKWQTVSQTVNVNAGTYNFGIFIRNSGVNINWIRITKTGSGAIVPVASSASEDEETDAASLNIYPNPVENTLFTTTDLTGGSISIVDSQTGAVISGQKINNNSIDVSNLRRGVYLLVFVKDGTKTVERFIKK